jgi:hypothetical protein
MIQLWWPSVILFVRLHSWCSFACVGEHRASCVECFVVRMQPMEYEKRAVLMLGCGRNG